MYLSNRVLSSECDVNLRLEKMWTANDRSSIIWKSNLLSNKTRFLPNHGCVSTVVWMHHMNANKMHKEKAR